MSRSDHARPLLGSTVIVIVGLHSSGKTTLARRISHETGRVILEMGDVVRAEASRRKALSLVKLANSLLESEPGFIVERILQKARTSGNHGLVIVGPRTALEFERLKASMGCFTVAVSTPDKIRSNRWRRRKLNYEDTWQERELCEEAWGTRDLAASCDLVVKGYDWVGYATNEILGSSPYLGES